MKLPPWLSRLPWYYWAVGGLFFLLGSGGTLAVAATPSGPSRPGGAPPVLKKGSSGPWVAYLRGLLGLSAGDSFDAELDTAVRAFQQQRGLTVDGIVGPQSWGALGVKASAPSGGGGGKNKKPSSAEAAAAAASSQEVSVPGQQGPTNIPGNGGLAEGQAQREKQILDAVAAGQAVISWGQVTSQANGHTAKIPVFARALRVDLGQGPMIVSLSYRATQQLADMLGLNMLTSKVSDLIWQQAQTRLAPTNQPWSQDGTMALTRRMVEQSNHIESKLAGRGGLVANEGKDWVVTKRFWDMAHDTPEGTKSSRHNAANFGWYLDGFSKSPGGLGVIQSVGLAHDKNHVDYSQLVRLMGKIVEVDGQQMAVTDVLASPELSPLLSDEGPLPAAHHPDL